jgi:hypothetical protein
MLASAPIILRDDNSDDDALRTFYSDLDIDSTTKTGSTSETATLSNGLGATCDGDKSSNAGDVMEVVPSPSIDHLPLSSFQRSPAIQQASELLPHNKVVEMNSTYIGQNRHDELDGDFAIFLAEDNHKNDEEHDSCDQSQFEYPNLPETTEQSGLESGPVPACHNRKSAIEDVSNKFQSQKPLTNQATDTSTASSGPNCPYVEAPQSCTSTAGSSRVLGLNQETATDGSIIDLGDEGCSKAKDYADPETEYSQPRNSARWAANKRSRVAEEDPSYSIDCPSQKRTKGTFNNVQGSEEISIHGCFTLKEVQSELVYCLTFTQGQLPSAHEGGPRQAVSTDSDKSQPAVSVTDHDQWRMRKVIGRKMMGGEMYCRVDWAPTWEPEAELGDAEELIDDYLATLEHVQREEPKKQRGRPRKQK